MDDRLGQGHRAPTKPLGAAADSENPARVDIQGENGRKSMSTEGFSTAIPSALDNVRHKCSPHIPSLVIELIVIELTQQLS